MTSRPSLKRVDEAIKDLINKIDTKYSNQDEEINGVKYEDKFMTDRFYLHDEKRQLKPLIEKYLLPKLIEHLDIDNTDKNNRFTDIIKRLFGKNLSKK